MQKPLFFFETAVGLWESGRAAGSRRHEVTRHRGPSAPVPVTDTTIACSLEVTFCTYVTQIVPLARSSRSQLEAVFYF